MKPIWIFTQDGHDGPRYPTTRQTLIKFFKDNDIDFLVAVCNAAGLSAYHFIERRMAPLSKELAGIILPHDTYGTHLDSNGVTIDSDKEKANFKKAGETFAKIWSETKIDEFPVSARWVDPSDDSAAYKNSTDAKIGANWLENHAYISKYCLQLAKCNDIKCCSPLRTPIQEVLGGKFLPTPLAFTAGPVLVDPAKKSEKTRIRGLFESQALQKMRPSNHKSTAMLPYDFYCPSVEIDNEEYVCSFCKKFVRQSSY